MSICVACFFHMKNTVKILYLFNPENFRVIYVCSFVSFLKNRLIFNSFFLNVSNQTSIISDVHIAQKVKGFLMCSGCIEQINRLVSI